MKTKIYTESVVSLEKDRRKTVLESLALIEDSLENGYFPHNIPENTSSAHIIYNDSPAGFFCSNYVINFFKEADPERANVSTGYHRFFSDDLKGFLVPENHTLQ